MTGATRLAAMLALLRADPGLGGIVLRGRAGPVRDAALAACRAALPDAARLHPGLDAVDLDGGIDVQATLAAGQVVTTAGRLDGRTAFLLPMAERTTPLLARRLADRLDAGAVLIACDEGIDEEALPGVLAERCAFCLDCDDPAFGPAPGACAGEVAAADLCPESPADLSRRLVDLALTLGIAGLTAPRHALRAARAQARLRGHATIAGEDVESAVPLVYAHRATVLPEIDPPEAPPPDPQTGGDDRQEGAEDAGAFDIPEDMLLAAVAAALPEGMLDRLRASKTRGGTGAGSGAKRKGGRRGRPLPARDRAGTGGRIDLLATLRAAAPWQTLRRRTQPDRSGPIVHKSDLRDRRYEETTDRLLIFTVDASGSAAFARLAEAKGAVEVLLAQAYARRDQVALIAFRGQGADLLLPPTRSLVQTKRRLADLPGGGPTPLAHGLQAAQALARTAARRGMTPTVVLMTDGRGNIALDGTADRARAAEDTAAATRALAADGVDAIVIDTGNRPDRSLRDLAATLRAAYVPLPRTDAKRLAAAVDGAMNPA